MLSASPILTAPAAARRRCHARRGVSLSKVRAASGPSAREPWDLGRFVKTVTFFNPGMFDVTKPLRALVTSLTGGKPDLVDEAPAPGVFVSLSGAPAPPPGPGGVVLVVGATGGVGVRVARLLLERGTRVRALVRDFPKARQLLAAADAAHPGLLEVGVGDVARPRSLGLGTARGVGRGVSAVVTCHSTRVQPKEGDTPDRAKYNQGVKFYDPEVVGDTPETVELKGMQHLLECCSPSLLHAPPPPVVLFDPSSPELTPPFGPLDDVVMGGASSSSFDILAGAGEGGGPAAVFCGNVSTANSGGFVSVRTRNWEPTPADCSGAAGFELRVFGDGQRYKLFVRTEPGWDAMAYGAGFDTPKGEWATVRMPLSSFKPIFRAMTVLGAPPLDPGRVRSLQLMLSKFEFDQQLNLRFDGGGAFRLPVERISAYYEPSGSSPQQQQQPSSFASASAAAPSHEPHRPASAPVWVHVSSAGVTRPNRPGIDVNAEPPAVRMNDALGGLLTYKLAAEDALRASSVPFAIVRPVALTEEPPGAELVLSQGDTIKGKVSRDDVAQLVVALLSQRAVCDVTFEVKSTVPFSQPWGGLPPGSPPRDWAPLLAPLRRGVTGRTINGVYTDNQPEEEALAAAAGAVAGAAGR